MCQLVQYKKQGYLKAKRGEATSTDFIFFFFRTDGKDIGMPCQRMLWLQKGGDTNERWTVTEKTVVS